MIDPGGLGVSLTIIGRLSKGCLHVWDFCSGLFLPIGGLHGTFASAAKLERESQSRLAGWQAERLTG